MKRAATRDKGLIVVGVDSSEGAKAALRFALEEAKFRQATLRAVHSWQFGYIGALGIERYAPVVGADLSDLRRTAEAALDATLDEAVPDAEGVVIERRVVEGGPATVLVDESRNADLLVVGSRGHGGFAGLLLGSVSQQCAHHAACPVVIVRAAEESGQVVDVRLKRPHEDAAAADGHRVLVDRISPRGVSREQVCLDEWARELAPSSELRRWFGHDPARLDEFRRRYTAGLAAQEGKLRRRARAGTLTLVYGARDADHSDAVVLAEILRRGRRS